MTIVLHPLFDDDLEGVVGLGTPPRNKERQDGIEHQIKLAKNTHQIRIRKHLSKIKFGNYASCDDTNANARGEKGHNCLTDQIKNGEVSRVATPFFWATTFVPKQVVTSACLQDEERVLKGHREQANLQPQISSSVRPHVDIREIHKNLSKLGDQEQIDRETELGEGEKPWAEFTPEVCKQNLDVIEDEVKCQTVLERWVYNGCEFAGRTVIPVDADVVSLEGVNEMTLGKAIESFAWTHPEFRIVSFEGRAG